LPGGTKLLNTKERRQLYSMRCACGFNTPPFSDRFWRTCVENSACGSWQGRAWPLAVALGLQSGLVC